MCIFKEMREKHRACLGVEEIALLRKSAWTVRAGFVPGSVDSVQCKCKFRIFISAPVRSPGTRPGSQQHVDAQ